MRRRVQALLFAMAIAMALALGASAGLAQPSEPVELVWRTPPDAECPSEQAMVAEIARILGPAEGPRKSVKANASVARAATRWRGTLTLQTEETESTRTFTGETCREAAAATALIVALAVDARAKPPASAPFSAPAPALPDAASSAPPAPPVVTDTPRAPAAIVEKPRPSGGESTSQVHLAGFVSAALDVGTLPALAVGVDLGVAVSVARLRFEVGAAYYVPQSTTLADRSSAGDAKGGDFTLFAATGRGCYLVEVGAIELGPCAAGRVVRVGATAFGTTASFDRGVTWAALGADGLASWHLSKRLALDLHLGGLVSLRRPSFVLNSTATADDLPVHRPATITFVGSLGGELRFF